MNENELIHFASQAMIMVLYLSMPVVLTATIVGLLVGLFQALTQIQEQTLSFGLKLIAVIMVMLVTNSWVGNEIGNYTDLIFDTIARMGRG